MPRRQCRVCSGDYPHRMEYQAISGSAVYDSRGQDNASPTTQFEVKAGIETLRGLELEQAQKIHAQVTHRIKTRYRSGITEEGSFLFRSRSFHIFFIDNVEERNQKLEILAGERK